MRLISLFLEGFRSYRQPVLLPLGEIRAAGIRGDNGHGKSSLPEAIEWAWFGTSRSSTVDGVVSTGAKVCVVELVWTQGDGIAYRVKRTRGRATQSLEVYSAALDLALAGGEVPWAPLRDVATADDTGGRGQKAAMQARLDRLLGLGRDALVASAIIRQGDAGRFTKAPASERAALLRSFIGIDQYEAWADEAGRRGRLAKKQAVELDTDLLRLVDLEAARATISADLVTVGAEGAAASTRLAEAQARRDAAAAALAAAREALAAARARSAERPRLEQGRSRAQVEYQTATNRLVEALKANLDDVVAAERVLPAIDEDLEAAQRALAECASAAQRMADLTAEKERERQTFEGEKSLHKVEADRLAALDAIDAPDLDALERDCEDAHALEMEQGRAVLAIEDEPTPAFPELSERIVAAMDQAVACGERLTTLDARLLVGVSQARADLLALERSASALLEQRKAADRRAALMAQASCSRSALWAPVSPDDEEPGDFRSGVPLPSMCPLVADARAARVEAGALAHEIAVHEDRLKAARAEVAVLDQVRVDRDAEAEALARAEREREVAERARRDAGDRARSDRDRRLEFARKVRDAARAAVFDARQARSAGEATAQRLTEREPLRAALAARSARMEAIQERAHDLGDQIGRARLDSELLPTRETQVAELRRRRALATDRAAARPAVEALVADVEPRRAAVAAAQARLADLDRDVESRPEPILEIYAVDDAGGAHQRAVEEVEQAQGADGEARTRQAALVERARGTDAEIERIAPLRERQAALELESTEWADAASTLTLAPTLLLENVAIPLIQRVANEVLGRISHGMAVRIDTQRATKDGKRDIETLDVVVSGDDGDRPYESFSGGEQFRVDIAIRIALSHLLTTRDRPVDFLILDEGFGSLDPVGVAALREVVAGLQSMYSLLLVISHIPEVTESLPHIITVTKVDGCSEVTIT